MLKEKLVPASLRQTGPMKRTTVCPCTVFILGNGPEQAPGIPSVPEQEEAHT